MSSNGILQPGQPRNFEGRNIRTPKRSGATNDIYLIQFEVTREAWEDLETVPKNAILGGVIWYSDGDPIDDTPLDLKIKPQLKKDMIKVKGSFSRYWQILCGQGLFNNQDLCEALRTDLPDQQNPEQALRDIMDVSSRTFISPESFETYLRGHGLFSIITISRQAEQKAKETEKDNAKN